MSSLYLLRVVRLEDVFWPSKPFRRKAPSLYVRVALDDIVRRTGIIRDSRSPEWDEILSFSSSDDAMNLNFQVKHRSSVFSNSCIACVDITLSDLLQKCADAGIELRMPPRKGQTTATHAGVLYLHLQVTDERTNSANDLDGVEQALAHSEIAHLSRVTDTTIAIVNMGQHSSGDSNLYNSLGTLCSKLDVFVKAIDAMSTVHPYVTVAWQLASGLYRAISNQFEADKKVIELVQAMNEAFKFADDADALVEKAQSLRDATVALVKQTCECCIFVQAYIRRSFTGRMLDLNGKSKIDEFTQAIAVLRRNVDSGTNLSAALISSRISERVDALFLRDRLEPRQSNAFGRPQCLAGTRVEIQKQILAWMFSDSDQNIFWLHGVAGSGKSTVGTTVAEYLSGVSRRGAFLCFERGKSEPDSVIRTIAYELAMFDSSIGKGVIAAIEQDNNVAMTSAVNQFEKLLLQPLPAASAAMCGPVVVVLDALDECGTPETRRDLLKVLGNYFRRLPKNFRFLITSRPEDDIRRAFPSQNILITSLDYLSETSRDDVVSYLRVELNRIVKEESEVPLPDDWRWEENVKRLGEAAGGLFIWASTAVKLVASNKDNPFQQLKELVENFRSLSLHELYATVLTSSISWEKSSSKSRFREVLSIISFSKEPLTVATIDGLLGYAPEASSRFLLSGLRSVVNYSPDGPARLFHASFSDYLFAPERSSDPWFMDVAIQKTHLAMRCFEVMKKSLRFNICGLESSYILNDDVPDLQNRVEAQIRPHLSYASLFWAQHLREAPFSSQLMEQLTEFLHQRLLYWLEVLSLSKTLGRCESILSDAMTWTPTHLTETLAFLKDAINLVASFFEGISQATPHLYVSLLPLAPTSSRVAAHYLKHTSLLVHVIRIGNERPPRVLKALKGHESAVLSVAFSPDGMCIASGSSDKTVRVWDTISGKVLAGPFRGHTDGITSVAFSHDGLRLASGSNDKTVRVWDVNSGEVIAGPFEGHRSEISSVAFSPDGTRLASGSLDSTVHLWDVDNGDLVVRPFEGHTEGVLSISFSPDGMRITSGSLDKTVRVWNAASGEVVAGAFEGHKSGVTSVSFSSDGMRIASGSHDKTVRVWDARSGEVVAGPFEGHADGVLSVSFSPDGSRIASGSCDGTAFAWDANRGEVVAGPFVGHTGWVASIAFSPDGTRLASGSYDATIRVWDAGSSELVVLPFQWHTSAVTSVSFSPDGLRIASGSGDKTIRVWDAFDGEVAAGPFKGHTDWVSAVTFSPNGTCIASGSYDGTIRLWNASSCEVVAGPFQGHTNRVASIAFSPDGTRLASGSYDTTVRVWNTNGELVAGPFFGHTNRVTSISFSPDGTRIASGSGDKNVHVWDAVTGEVVAGPFEGATDEISSVAFSPDGTRVAAGSYDRTIRLWDANSGDVVAGPFVGHTSRVTSVSFSPDGMRLASGSYDCTVRVWDANSGEMIAGPLEGQRSVVTSVMFSPDGLRLVSGSYDNTVRVWDVAIAVEYNKHSFSLHCRPSFSNWSVDELGWLKSGDDILFWIPPTLRGILYRPQNTLILGWYFHIKLDFADSALGNDWHKCFRLV